MEIDLIIDVLGPGQEHDDLVSGQGVQLKPILLALDIPQHIQREPAAI